MENFGLGKEGSTATFIARVEEKAVVLKWSATTSDNFDRFVIQRSADGENFFTIMVIVGRAFSNDKLNYDTTDLYPLSGHSWYRLKLVNQDGSEEVLEQEIDL